MQREGRVPIRASELGIRILVSIAVTADEQIGTRSKYGTIAGKSKKFCCVIAVCYCYFVVIVCCLLLLLLLLLLLCYSFGTVGFQVRGSSLYRQ